MHDRRLLAAFAIATPVAIIALIMLGWFDIALAMGLAAAGFALLIRWRERHGSGKTPLFSHFRPSGDDRKYAGIRSIHVQLALAIGGAFAIHALMFAGVTFELIVLMGFVVGFLAFLSWVHLPR